MTTQGVIYSHYKQGQGGARTPRSNHWTIKVIKDTLTISQKLYHVSISW